MTAPPVLWEPTARTIASARITRYMDRLRRGGGPQATTYDELWRWSTDDLDGFWRSICDEFDVITTTPATSVLRDGTMPGASWFDGATLNYAGHLLRPRGDEIAIRAYAEGAEPRTLTRDELAHAVGSAASALRALGVSEGDRVAAFLPNGIEAVVALLATASIGAIWSACSPDFGPGAVIDRFRQIEPTVLIAVDGYRYGGREHDRLDVVRSIVEQLPTLRAVVLVTNLRDGASVTSGMTPWEDVIAAPQEPAFTPVPFSHPLWIVYSSGTTGLPKAMVQGHGGILLEHLKSLGLHLDLRPDDRLFWFTTTGWMMWNFIVSGLALGTSLVLYDGSPAAPDLGALWRLAERAGVTYFGTSAPFLQMSMKRRMRPRDLADLSALRAIGSTGAPLSADGFRWVYDSFGPEIWLGSISGGTDLCTAFVGSCPVLPVYEGEIQCRSLGAKVAAYDDAGRPVIDRVGELVIEAPMPSMPLSFWNDPDGRRYRESYFDAFPGVWRHGDWIEISSRGTCRIFGRSDATLNRGGVRIGTAEFYRVVEALDGVRDALAVDTGDAEHEGRLILFVVLDDGVELDRELERGIAGRLRDQLSPRHVPDAIVQAPGVPTTLNGKRMEVPVKRLLHGEPLERVASLDAVSDAELLRWYAERAERLSRGR